MKKPIITRDLTQHAPHSPRARIAGFVIASRAIDKCRAVKEGLSGEYHYDCPLDNMLFEFKGITGEEFKKAVLSSTSYEEVGAWLQSNGIKKSSSEIKIWSDGMEASSPMANPERRESFIENCHKVGLDPDKNTLFDWLEADDRASFIN